MCHVVLLKWFYLYDWQLPVSLEKQGMWQGTLWNSERPSSSGANILLRPWFMCYSLTCSGTSKILVTCLKSSRRFEVALTVQTWDNLTMKINTSNGLSSTWDKTVIWVHVVMISECAERMNGALVGILLFHSTSFYFSLGRLLFYRYFPRTYGGV